MGVPERLFAGDFEGDFVSTFETVELFAVSVEGLPLAGDLDAFEGVGSDCWGSTAFGSQWAGAAAGSEGQGAELEQVEVEHEPDASHAEPNINANSWINFMLDAIILTTAIAIQSSKEYDN